MKAYQGVLVGLITGAVIGAVFSGIYMYQGGYGDAQKEIRARLQQTGLVSTPPAVMKSVTGTVKAVTKSQIMLDVLAPFDPTAIDQTPTTYTITYEAPEVITSEIDFNMIPKPNVPFNPIVEKKATMADVKDGAIITVESGANITSTLFTANKITINK